MTKSNHRYYNANPKKKEVGDCVVRAVCKATGKEWDEVFKELFDIAMDLKVMPNDKEAYTKYLEEIGFKYNKVSNKKGSKRPRVHEIAKTTKNTEEIIVCNVANHLVTVSEGVYWDTWDSGECCLYGFWSK